MGTLNREEITLLQEHSLRQMVKAGYSSKEIAKLCGVSGDTIWSRLKEHKIRRIKSRQKYDSNL